LAGAQIGLDGGGGGAVDGVERRGELWGVGPGGLDGDEGGGEEGELGAGYAGRGGVEFGEDGGAVGRGGGLVGGLKFWCCGWGWLDGGVGLRVVG